MPRIAVVGTGGTISSIGRDAFDIADYGALGKVMGVEELLDFWPQARELADVVPVPFRAVPSTALGPPEWLELARLCASLAADGDGRGGGFDGIVVTHGTATLEETAYFLALTNRAPTPIVLVGAQRPSSGLSSDAGMNLANAIRVAADPGARGLGALVLLNDEIHAARDVSKTSTSRLQTFQSPDFGCLGHADFDTIAWYRRPVREVGGFDVAGVAELPRVDIVPCYAGADGVAVEAFRAAGAKGLVSAGLPPGYLTPALMETLSRAIAEGVPVAQSSRAGSGRVFHVSHMQAAGFLSADNLTPQKARVLLMLALTQTADPAALQGVFARM